MKKIEIVDTTLRDGEQAAGVNFNLFQKKHLARCLDGLGVDIIEVGIPAMGKEEIQDIYEINNLNLNTQLLTWNRMKISDIDCSIETGCKNVHITVPASDVHIKKKLNKTHIEVVNEMKKVIAYAKSKDLRVSIGAEDASRADFDFLIYLYTEAKREGATRIRYADTLGALDPFNTYEIIKQIKLNVDLPLDFHGHNDLGLATANGLGAIRGGAEIISCSINGLGERAGNTPLEEIAVILKLKDLYDTSVDISQLTKISKIVENYSGRKLEKQKPIVGEEVFSHESGIHVDGLLKDSNTYELFAPELLGRQRKIVIGKHSGKKAIEHWIKENGYKVQYNEIKNIIHTLNKDSNISSFTLM
ncbi:homocitrate synthase NifV [Natranaerovirga pectinivora]|uniref:Homocitrate synthase NifV n=1 Tax=Natranaerovirga pectinivora TaxID=682400 RepID=A0A4R3MQ56_9FIRM|nr:homoaconitate hydratase [Natranaerovirga pectinivora]TCT15301.1 homocitrate synthase NifV [Natranaerovirga pectinivora]